MSAPKLECPSIVDDEQATCELSRLLGIRLWEGAEKMYLYEFTEKEK